MKQQNYTDHAITSATKLLGYESDSPQQTFNYPALGAFVPFIPSTAKQFIGIIQQAGLIFGPSLIPMTGTTNQIGTVQSSTRQSAGEYIIEFESGTFESGTLYAFPGCAESGTPLTIVQISIDPLDVNNSKLKVNNVGLIDQLNTDGFSIPIHLILV